MPTTTPPPPWPDDAGRGIAVLGSINRDLSLRVPHLPRAGETLHALGSPVALGGKGANQAVAARLAGVPTAFFGAVGDDADGCELLAALRAADVGVRIVVARRGQPTGSAVVIVDEAGDNVIIVAAGANGSVDQDYLDRAWPLIRTAASVLLVQGEIPAEVNRAAIGLAARDGIRVVVNLAPYQELDPVTGHADPLVVNEVEAGQLLGTAISSVAAALDAAHALARRARSVVITLGAQGAVAAVAGGGTLSTCLPRTSPRWWTPPVPGTRSWACCRPPCCAATGFSKRPRWAYKRLPRRCGSTGRPPRTRTSAGCSP